MTGLGAQDPEKWEYANPWIQHSTKNDEMYEIYDALLFKMCC